MQQRRVRLGDVLDDYCPRERRVTNHVVVAMIEDEVKQTRCTTCEADHEFKHARVPAARRKKLAAVEAGGHRVPEPTPPAASAEAVDPPTLPETSAVVGDADRPEVEVTDRAAADDDWPVHRRLIRATLPRPEGQAPERKTPEFTMHQPGGRPDGRRGGHRRGKGQFRHAKGPQGQFSGNSHFGHGSRHGGGQQGNRRHGNVHPQSSGQPGGQRSHRRAPKRGR
jgi:hypothetical protein